MVQVLLSLLLAARQDPAEEATKAVDALVALKEDDEDGRDLLTDRLLKLGEKALDRIESRLEQLQGAPAFRLRCVRDMIWYPIDVKAAYSVSEGDSTKTGPLKLMPGDIYLSFNGQRITGHLEYTRALRKAESEGLTEAVIEILQKGRRRTVKIPGLRMGGYLSDYPHDLAAYVHRGHRGPAWEEKVHEALGPSMEHKRSYTIEKLAAAVRDGCRDELVLMRAMFGLLEHGKPEESKALWELCGGKFLSTGHAAEVQADCRYVASRVFLECGEAAMAMTLAKESEKRMDGPGFAIHRAFQKGYQGIILQEQEPGRAVELLRAAVEEQRKLRNDNLWLQMALVHALKRQARWDECARLGWIFDRHNFNGHDQAPYRDGLRLMGEYDRPPKVLIPRQRLYSGPDAVARGVGDGLTGEYFSNETLEGKPLKRVDPVIDFPWELGSPDPSIPVDHFSVRWTGMLEPESSGTYTFTTRTDDGVRLWVDGKLLVDRWVPQAPTEWSGTLDLEAGKKVDLKMEYYEGAVGAVAHLFWNPPSFSTGQAQWALVYRQNFEVPEVGLSYFQGTRAPDKRQARVEDGHLSAPLRYVKGLERGWNSYDDVRIEADFQMLWQQEEGYRGTTVGLSACINKSRNTEAGAALSWPREFQSSLYAENSTWSYQPGIDLRKPHRLSIEIRQGKAVSKIDGKWVNTQVLPAGWSGVCGLRQDGMPFECDNLEVYVPSATPTDESRVRALYDKAAADFKAGRVDDAMAALEGAAALQPRSDDLGRLYAAYLVAARKDRADLWKRLAQAETPKVVEMLLEAEVQVDLLSAREEQSALYTELHRRTLEGQAPSVNELSGLAESTLSGPLMLYLDAMRARYVRGAASGDEVLEACRRARRQAPESRALAYRLVRFCLAEKKADAAVRAALDDLVAQLPKATFLKEWIDAQPR